MSVGQGIGQGLMFLANQIAQKRAGERRQAQALEMFNLRRQAALEDLAQREEMQEGKRKKKFQDVGSLLMQLDPSLAQQYEGMTPEALGQAQSLGILSGLQQRQAEAQKQAQLKSFLQDPNLPETTRQALQYQALTGRGGTAAFRLPGQMESDLALQQYREAQRGLIPLKAEGLRARTAATRQRAALADPTQFETVSSVDPTTGQKVTSKRRRGQQQAGQSSADRIAKLIQELE